jgi:predicted outer membrane protein
LSDAEPQPQNDFEQKMMAAHKANSEKLQALEGKVFDKAYLTAMVGAHDSTLAKLTSGAQQFRQGELSTLLTQTMGKVRQHREHAYRLLGKEGKAQGVGGSGSEQSSKSSDKQQ